LSRAFRPVDPKSLPHLVAGALAATPSAGRALRVAVDGAPPAEPTAFAQSLAASLRALGRDTTIVRAESFWRDASLRLEYGREDVESFLTWLDERALRREVLDPLGPDGSGIYLPSMRDPETNRATREPPRRAAAGAVVIVSGSLLLGLGLPFDVTIHLAMSPGARARRIDAACRWTLEAFDRYDADVSPAAAADIAIRIDDPAHPAIG